jgi:hypothetical protein
MFVSAFHAIFVVLALDAAVFIKIGLDRASLVAVAGATAHCSSQFKVQAAKCKLQNGVSNFSICSLQLAFCIDLIAASGLPRG